LNRHICHLTLGNVWNMDAPTSLEALNDDVRGVMTPPSGVPTLGLAEAAQACGVSLSTIRRKRPELKALGAAETAHGWQIPVTALITIGLMGRTTEARHDTRVKPGVKPATAGPTKNPSDTPSTALRAQLDALRIQLADAEKRAAVAEAVAAERERLIEVQQAALRMLEAPKPHAQPVQEAPQAPPLAERQPSTADTTTTPGQPARRRWWQLR
jgi:hypothetical protein